MAVDMEKLEEMTGKVLTDIGATFHAPLVLIGEKLGLFKKLAEESLTPTKTPAEPIFISAILTVLFKIVLP